MTLLPLAIAASATIGSVLFLFLPVAHRVVAIAGRAPNGLVLIVTLALALSIGIVAYEAALVAFALGAK